MHSRIFRFIESLQMTQSLGTDTAQKQCRQPVDRQRNKNKKGFPQHLVRLAYFGRRRDV